MPSPKVFSRPVESDDSFFDELEEELDAALRDDVRATSKSETSESDDVFARLEQEMSGETLPNREDNDSAKDDEDAFFRALESEINADIESPVTSVAEKDDVTLSEKGDLFPSHQYALNGSHDKAEKSGGGKGRKNINSVEANSVEDFKSLTIPLLKEKLRDKGLKVSGKKAELIERLLTS